VNPLLFRRLSKQYSSPQKVQNFLRTLKYNREETGETVRSAAETFRLKKAHCLEATLLAAAILDHQGYPPLVINFDSIDHLCHAIFIFKTKTGWGSVARSREPGLHGREPKFRSIRDLAWSYFDPFIDKTGRITGYVRLNLDESGTDWRFSKRNLWKLEKLMVYTQHIPLRSSDERFRKFFNRYQKQGSLLNGPHWW